MGASDYGVKCVCVYMYVYEYVWSVKVWWKENCAKMSDL